MALGLGVDDLAREFGVSVRVLYEFEMGVSELPGAGQYRPVLERLERERNRDRAR
jgi:hypothetical protein